MQINLKEKFLLAKGSERSVYVHPKDESKVIKVLYNQKSKNNQNEIEYKYYKYLENKKVSFEHITNCYGWINTNLGKGLIFDRVEAIQLTYFIKNKLLDEEHLTLLLEDLKLYLEKNQILFTDVATLNVMCKKISENNYKLIIIDGLGPKRDGFKSFLYLKFNLYNRYKIRKQWKTFLNMIDRLK
ncbi:YrbL family protein [Aliarcobacter butzleri]